MISRRLLIKGAFVSGVTLSVMSAAAALPTQLWAAWNKSAFTAKKMDEAIMAHLGSTKMTIETKIKIKAPNIAENGAVVPISVTAEIPGIESISIFVKNNPTPLIASFMIPEGTKPMVSTRIKMAKTSDLYAVVKANGKLLENHKEIKVTIGGCGG